MVYQQLQTRTLQKDFWQPQQVHCNLSQRAIVDANEIIWYPAPYPGIWFGCFVADDSVQEHPLTMLTRFEPGGVFPTHDHPGGEEILVIQGSFTDETGDYPVGSYLMNPEGFSHFPMSANGCVTFVKLRQHGGNHRQQIRANINDLLWQPSSVAQIDVKPL
jgi:hypothetical protein